MTFSSSICLPLLISRDGNGFMSLRNTPDRSVEFCCYSISFLFFVNPGMRSEDLEQPRCALSAADAHGNDAVFGATALAFEDRKSTRLNSSHLVISYAVFCLKKKKQRTTATASHGAPKVK